MCAPGYVERPNTDPVIARQRVAQQRATLLQPRLLIPKSAANPIYPIRFLHYTFFLPTPMASPPSTTSTLNQPALRRTDRSIPNPIRIRTSYIFVELFTTGIAQIVDVGQPIASSSRGSSVYFSSSSLLRTRIDQISRNLIPTILFILVF